MSGTGRNAARTVAVFMIAAGLSGPVLGQTDPGSSAGTESQSSELDSGGPEDGDLASADVLEGPSSVTGQLERDREAQRVAGPQTLKDRLRSRYGLSLGVDYNVLAQQISPSPGESAGVGGVARAYGRWDLVGRDRDPDVGALIFKVEYRNSLGTALPPQEVLSTSGVAGMSGPTFSAAGGVLTNLYWTQAFADNRVAFIAGVVDPTDYVDVYALVNPWTDFNNLAFSTNPTIQVPNQGFGMAARWSFTSQAYVLGGLSDANADPHRPGDFASSFADGEYFKHLEFGLMGSWATRMSHNVHVLLWQVDDRKEASVEGGWGATCRPQPGSARDLLPDLHHPRVVGRALGPVHPQPGLRTGGVQPLAAGPSVAHGVVRYRPAGVPRAKSAFASPRCTRGALELNKRHFSPTTHNTSSRSERLTSPGDSCC